MTFRKKRNTRIQLKNIPGNKDKPMAMFDDERGRYFMDGERMRIDKKAKMFIQYEDRKE